VSLAGIFVHAPRTPAEPPFARLRAGWRLLIFAVTVESVSALAGGIAQSVFHLSGGLVAGSVVIGEGLQFAIAALFTLLMAWLEGRRFGVYGLGGRARHPQFWIGSLWGFLAVAALIALIMAARGLTIDGLALHGGDLGRYVLLWTLGMIGIGLYEEVYFRGYPLYTLASGMGFWPAAVALSALFGAIHFFLKPMENGFDFLSVSLIALFLCLTLRRTGSLWFAIGFHFAFDWAALFVFAAPNTANQGQPVEGHLLDVRYTGPAWLTGGPLGIEASVMVFIVIAALFALFNARYRETRWPADGAAQTA
jgi:hypothetical protein